ncbi:hypothetical protein BpHYR1_054177, partial [Brachionus plicatilis]
MITNKICIERKKEEIVSRCKSSQIRMGKKNVSSPQKWQIVGLLKSGDKKQNEIAKLLGVSPKC